LDATGIQGRFHDTSWAAGPWRQVGNLRGVGNPAVRAQAKAEAEANLPHVFLQHRQIAGNLFRWALPPCQTPQSISVHGSNGFDAVEFLDYIRERRVLFPVSCGVAILLALGVSLAIPKRYTAKSSILIEAPEGTDPRASTAMSPAYLESLRTYETFASSDTLFQHAIERLHVEGSKGSVLKVSMPANTAVVEISATLTDPRKAQALAQYIAEQTVELDRAIEGKSADDPIREQDGFDRELRLEEDLARARTDLAELNSEAEPDRRRLASALARIQAIDNQRRELAGLLEKQRARGDRRARLKDARSSPESRGGRLHVIDPGVVPQQAVFPNTRLNVAAALLASLTGTFAWLLLRFSYVRLQRERSERVYSLR